MLETRWGECQFCKRTRVLYYVLGSYSGKQIWAGWICRECFEKQQRKDWGDEMYDKLFGVQNKEE